MRFSGTVSVITGGGSGIGRATALAFAGEGSRVVVMDIDETAAKSTYDEILKAGGVARYFPGDISNTGHCDGVIGDTVDHFGRVDFLFNNAGVEFIAPLAETTNEQFDAVADVNYKGTFMMSRAAIKQMLRTGGGVIVNNASDAGLRGIHVNAVYSSSKAAIIHLTRSIALDYGGQGIRCNCICPGCIRTPLCERFNAEVGARHGKTGEEALHEFVTANIPMQRVGTPEEVASVVLFLCSKDAAYINGAILPIDGGLTAGM